MFDVLAYMEAIRASLKLTKDDYLFARVSGVDNLEEVLSNSKRHNKFFAVNDAQNFQTLGGTHYNERRHYTIYLLAKCGYNEMDKRTAILAEARAIYRSILSKMIVDRHNQANGLESLSTARINANEVPSAFADGMAGIYFSFHIDNPVDLTFNAADWI